MQCIRDIKKLNPESFTPYNGSRTLTHMLTISEGVFVAVDLTNATVRAFANSSESNADVIAGILKRANFNGIVHLGISVKRELSFTVADIKSALRGKEV